MGKRTLIEQLCHALGKNNDASYAVVAVATAKGIFRPMFTMMDKHEEYETKKYTAIREGMTEVIAIPCYMMLPKLAQKVIAPLICNGKHSDKVQTAGKTLSFVAVCVSALIIIPAVCSAAINPIMDFMAENKKRKQAKLNNIDLCDECKAKTLDIKEVDDDEHVVAPVQASTPLAQVNASTPLKKTYSAFQPINYNSGLTIGGGK